MDWLLASKRCSVPVVLAWDCTEVESGMNQETSDLAYRNQKATRDISVRQDLAELEKKSYGDYGATSASTNPAPFWECIMVDEGVFGSEDWEVHFNLDTCAATVTYPVQFRKVTGGGELWLPLINGSPNYARRHCKLSVYARMPQDINCFLSRVGTSGSVQIVVNGTIQTFSGSGDSPVTVSLVPGHNYISIATNFNVDSLQFEGLLFDGVNSFWVNPLGYANPTRSDYDISLTSIATAPAGTSSSNAAGGLVVPEGS